MFSSRKTAFFIGLTLAILAGHARAGSSKVAGNQNQKPASAPPNRRTRAVLAALTAAACLSALPALAQNATWLANPASSVWGTATNWTPTTVPTGTASFGASNTTSVLITSPVTINTMQFTTGAPAYSFSIGGLSVPSLVFTGAGIVNNSSNAPSIKSYDANYHTLDFYNSSTAGNAILNINNGSVTFPGASTAGTATITNTGGLDFTGVSTAGNAAITNNASTVWAYIAFWISPARARPGTPPLRTISAMWSIFWAQSGRSAVER